MHLISDLPVSGRRVFLRADLDVPLEKSVETATRLTNLKPTVDYLLKNQAKQIIIAGHIDRPEKPDPTLSTKNLINDLEKILSRSVTFKLDFENGDRTLASIAQLVLFENLRFWPGEVANDANFAKQLASMADIYINEAFGNCHREHTSMVSLPGLLPHAAGLHLQKEMEVLSKVLKAPEHPFVAIVGGAKIETKVPVIENLAKIADYVLVGGAIAKELRVESSLLPDNSKMVVASLTADTKDISEESTREFKTQISSAKTVVWNGPMGVFEEGFDLGTRSIAQSIIESGAYSVVGGGDTTQFLGTLGLLSRFSFVSAGGGAMLEFLSGKQLPGIKALN